jgi:protein-tyrosine-phosphatase
MESLIRDSNLIEADRKELLDELSIYIREKITTHKEVSLVFICTHNSRRSHMAQVWAQAAVHQFGIDHVHTFSGGTEKTAFNSNAVKALSEAGFKIRAKTEGKNPKYQVAFDKKVKPLICFSKTYNHKKNPQQGFVAIMTCSDADDACPVVAGAEYRTTIKYEDPKIFDGTDQQESAYRERSLQIGREMLYTFSQVSRLMR